MEFSLSQAASSSPSLLCTNLLLRQKESLNFVDRRLRGDAAFLGTCKGPTRRREGHQNVHELGALRLRRQNVEHVDVNVHREEAVNEPSRERIARCARRETR